MAGIWPESAGGDASQHAVPVRCEVASWAFFDGMMVLNRWCNGRIRNRVVTTGSSVKYFHSSHHEKSCNAHRRTRGINRCRR